MKDIPKKPVESQEKREEGERWLDEAIEESFPASDPLPTARTSIGAPDERQAKKSHERPPHKKPD